MKNVIITGGANGLGFELAKVLHDNDYYICAIDKDEKGLNRLTKNLKDNYKLFVGDVSDEKFVVKTFKEIYKNVGIFALINCAGSPSFKFPNEYTGKDVDLCFEGLKGMIYCSTQF